MDELLISSCPTAFLRWKRSRQQANIAISIFRAVSTSCAYTDNLIYCDRYDKLVIAVGSVSSTHGVPGLEHCFQLKTVADAQAIRRRILGGHFYPPNPPIHPFSIADNFETASLPSTSEEERKQLLSFVVCGGGPTGVETAAVRIFVYANAFASSHTYQEIFDLCQEDIINYVGPVL